MANTVTCFIIKEILMICNVLLAAVDFILNVLIEHLVTLRVMLVVYVRLGV